MSEGCESKNAPENARGHVGGTSLAGQGMVQGTFGDQGAIGGTLPNFASLTPTTDPFGAPERASDLLFSGVEGGT